MKLIMRTTSWIQKTEKKKKTQLFVRVLVDEDRKVEPTKDVTMFVLLSLIFTYSFQQIIYIKLI